MMTKRINARGKFRWSNARSRMVGNVRHTAYLVWTAHDPKERELCLGAIERHKEGWRIIPFAARGFGKMQDSIHRTREEAAIGLVVYLNRFAYGRKRLDSVNFTDYRTPR